MADDPSNSVLLCSVSPWPGGRGVPVTCHSRQRSQCRSCKEVPGKAGVCTRASWSTGCSGLALTCPCPSPPQPPSCHLSVVSGFPQPPDHLSYFTVVADPLTSSWSTPPTSLSLSYSTCPPCPVSAPTQVGLLSYSHRPSPLFPLNSSHDLGVILQKIRDIPYVDPSGNNLGKDRSQHGLLGLFHQVQCLGFRHALFPRHSCDHSSQIPLSTQCSRSPSASARRDGPVSG